MFLGAYGCLHGKEHMRLTSPRFVGLTPGIMVSYACLQWIYGVFSSRKGLKVGIKDDFRHAMR